MPTVMPLCSAERTLSATLFCLDIQPVIARENKEHEKPDVILKIARHALIV